jgi:hypothetical protein
MHVNLINTMVQENDIFDGFIFPIEVTMKKIPGFLVLGIHLNPWCPVFSIEQSPSFKQLTNLYSVVNFK